MPETRRHAIARAKLLGFPISNVVRGKRGYFIAPRGLHKHGKEVYAALRSKGMSKERAAKIAHGQD